MVSLIVHFVIGILVIAWIVRANPQIFRRPASGPMFSVLEISYYVIGVASNARPDVGPPAIHGEQVCGA